MNIIKQFSFSLLLCSSFLLANQENEQDQNYLYIPKKPTLSHEIHLNRNTALRILAIITGSVGATLTYNSLRDLNHQNNNAQKEKQASINALIGGSLTAASAILLYYIRDAK